MIKSDKQQNRLLILYSEVMPYTLAVIEALIEDFGYKVLVVYWDKKRLTPFDFTQTSADIQAIPRSQFTRRKDCQRLIDFEPTVVWTSGRMDSLYLEMNLIFKKKGVDRVMGSDDQWSGQTKDLVKATLSYVLYRRYFNYCWVPGDRQYVFADKIGFDKSNILKYFYSCSKRFFTKSSPIKEKRILYVGRFAPAKNVPLLIQAFKGQVKNFPEWKLRLIGVADIPFELINHSNIEVFSFESQEKLMEHAEKSAIFCLPSLHEPWGVVVHEFAAQGMPLLLSNRVGAIDRFLIEGFNGLSFDPENLQELTLKMDTMMEMSFKNLRLWGENSRILAQNVTPKLAAASFNSISEK